MSYSRRDDLALQAGLVLKKIISRKFFPSVSGKCWDFFRFSQKFFKNQRKNHHGDAKCPKFLPAVGSKSVFIEKSKSKLSNLAKIAPEGRENFGGRTFFHFQKTNKKTLVTHKSNTPGALITFNAAAISHLCVRKHSVFVLIFLCYWQYRTY